MRAGSWERTISIARSQLCHNGWVWVSGNFGEEIGWHSWALIIRSLRRKFLKSAATIRSWRKSFLNSARGRVFHAMVSVIAVNIQLSSPRGLLRSCRRPGTLNSSTDIFVCKGFCKTKYLRAISMGVVKQHVKRSAGRSGLVGNVSVFSQAASRIQSL